MLASNVDVYVVVTSEGGVPSLSADCIFLLYEESSRGPVIQFVSHICHENLVTSLVSFIYIATLIYCFN